MAKSTVQLSLRPEADSLVRQKLLAVLARKLTLALLSAQGRVAERVGDIAEAAVRACPEYTALISGSLRGELGVVDAEPIVSLVINNIRSGVRVEVRPVVPTAVGLSGGLTIRLLKSDMSEALSAGGVFKSEGGFQIPWLRWLTTGGSEVLVSDFHFSPGHRDRSRTGQGIMLRGGSWAVPSQYAGTDADNWLTRALHHIGPDVAEMLQEELTRSL